MARKTTKTETPSIRERLLAAEKQLNSVFIKRKDAIRVMLLAHLCREHYLFVGDPGTGKTRLATAFAGHVTGAKYFSTLFGAFTSPEKVWGVLDIKEFQAGKYRNVTENMLPDAHLAFLDEYFKAGEGLLNELLPLMNERVFAGKKTPLMTVGTATNWPEMEQRTDNVAALYDRTLLRCVVEDLHEEDDVVALLEAADKVEEYVPAATVTVEELAQAADEVKAVVVSEDMHRLLAKVRQTIAWRQVGGQRKPGVQVSSRRINKLRSVLKASAWLAGRSEVTVADFDALQWGMWNDRADREVVRAALEGIDREEVQAITDLVDEARSKYRQLERSGFGPARIAEVSQAIKTAASEARARFERPVFTDRGRREVKDAMAGLKADFQALQQRAQG